MMKLAEIQKIAKSLDKAFLIDVGIRYAVIAGFFLLALVPTFWSTVSLKAQNQKIRQEISEANSKITEASHIGKNKVAAQTLISSVEERFFTEDELAQLISIISDIAKENNLQTVASKPILKEGDKKAPAKAPPVKAPKPPKPPPKGRKGKVKPLPPPKPVSPDVYYSTHDFEVHLSGGYHDLGKFLSTLKKQEKLIWIKKLTVISGPNTPNGQHDITIVVSAYSKIDSPKLP